MHIVPVMPPPVELVCAEIAQLVFGGGFKSVRGLVPFAGLRPNVPWHMQRMGNVGHKLRVSPAARPSIPGKRGTFEPMNDVVVHAGMVRRFDYEIADRKSTRLNSSHSQISYAVFCLKKKKRQHNTTHYGTV